MQSATKLTSNSLEVNLVDRDERKQLQLGSFDEPF